MTRSATSLRERSWPRTPGERARCPVHVGVGWRQIAVTRRAGRDRAARGLDIGAANGFLKPRRGADDLHVMAGADRAPISARVPMPAEGVPPDILLSAEAGGRVIRGSALRVAGNAGGIVVG